MSIEVTVGLDFFRVFLEVSCGIVEFSIADKVARSVNFYFKSHPEAYILDISPRLWLHSVERVEFHELVLSSPVRHALFVAVLDLMKQEN
jgi:hypothetical protein